MLRWIGWIAIGLLLAAHVLVPETIARVKLARRARIKENEREAGAGLKTLGTAEADFRSNDRDANGINDFWTGDVAGLYAVRDARGEPIRLILREIAEADADPLPEHRLVDRPKAFHGYFFRVIRLDAAGVRYSEPPGDARHNPNEFGICAFPAEYGVTGRHTFFLSEGFTIFKRDLRGRPVEQFPADDAPYVNWHND